MELGTFGAILGFAMDLEKRVAVFYGRAAPGDLGRVFDERVRDVKKRLRRLERARRELVSEMILESITGLDGDDYAVTLDAAADEEALLAQARDLEAASTRFYRDAATKMPIREVARLFERMADEHARCGHEGG
jgi:rubrerythrin